MTNWAASIGNHVKREQAADVLRILQEAARWVPVHEIVERQGMGVAAVEDALDTLARQGAVYRVPGIAKAAIVLH